MININYEDIDKFKNSLNGQTLQSGAFTKENFDKLCEKVKNQNCLTSNICEVVVPVKWIMDIEDESFDELKESVKDAKLVMLEYHWYYKVMGYYINKKFPIDKEY